MGCWRHYTLPAEVPQAQIFETQDTAFTIKLPLNNGKIRFMLLPAH
jgi:hypothetical protein